VLQRAGCSTEPALPPFLVPCRAVEGVSSWFSFFFNKHKGEWKERVANKKMKGTGHKEKGVGSVWRCCEVIFISVCCRKEKKSRRAVSSHTRHQIIRVSSLIIDLMAWGVDQRCRARVRFVENKSSLLFLCLLDKLALLHTSDFTLSSTFHSPNSTLSSFTQLNPTQPNSTRMGYEYILLAAAIIVPLGIFSIFKGDPTGAVQVGNEKRSSLPGAFGNDNNTSAKSKKKKSKKKNKGANTATTGVTGAAAGNDDNDESSESEVEEKKTMTRQNKKSNSSPTQVVPPTKKANNNSKGSNTTHSSSSPSAASIPSSNNKPNSGSSQESAKAKSNNNNNSNTASKKTTVASAPTVTAPSSAATGNKATSVEDWKKQRQAEQREILAKQQETLQFSSAASKNTSSFSSSPNVTSIPGPGAMGNNKKKNRGQAGAGLSHAEFPSLSRPEPAPAPAPKQPKQKKDKKDKVAVKPEPVPEPQPEPVQESEDESDEDNKEQQMRDDQLMAQQLAWSEGDAEQEEEEEEDEWTTVSGNGAAPARSGGIDFSKPMDPWVAQRQRQLQDDIAAADPHGEQTTQFARVLSIKPSVKEERSREAIPDGFSVQKSKCQLWIGSKCMSYDSVR
jgi:hypothetical protein